MPTVAITTPSEANTRHWCDMLASQLPDWTFEPLGEVSSPEFVEYCVAWRPPEGSMVKFTHLKAIVSIGSGIDHLYVDSQLPKTVPIIRTLGEDLTQRMREYVLLHVLRHHRKQLAFHRAQVEADWHRFDIPIAQNRRVGIMGLGNLGAVCAQTVANMGFDTVGWSRSPKQLDGVTTYHGEDQLTDFLKECEILVCMLPLTSLTRDILSSSLFSLLPKGASLINVARGEHLIEQDLIEALDSGLLSEATLDVFRQEPLPLEHPFWHHPAITVTPHIASRIDAATGSRIIARNLVDFERDGWVTSLADPQRGY